MPTVIVMAQGQQQRIGHLLGGPGVPAFKQLLPVQGEATIFSRTCRLFLEAGASVVLAVVHDHPEWRGACASQMIPSVIQQDPAPCVLDGVYNMRHLWGRRTVIALGDVVYSRATVRRMVVDRRLALYERPGRNTTTGKPFSERFGITFGREHHAELLGGLENRSFRRHQDNKLLHLKGRLLGLEVADVYDYTDDVDGEEWFFKWLPLLREAVAADS